MNVTKVITHREQLGYWLNDNGLLGTGVEVGCAFGQYSARILSQWKGKAHYMVDPWENLPDSEYREAHTGIDYNSWYDSCQGLAKSDGRVTLIRLRSVEAAKQFEAHSLDFVYIDGNHDYGFVMQDLDAWFPKVKAGGLIGGHDFYDKFDGGHFCGVASAVLRWMAEHGMPFTVTPCTSWWAIKQ